MFYTTNYLRNMTNLVRNNFFINKDVIFFCPHDAIKVGWFPHTLNYMLIVEIWSPWLILRQLAQLFYLCIVAVTKISRNMMDDHCKRALLEVSLQWSRNFQILFFCLGTLVTSVTNGKEVLSIKPYNLLFIIQNGVEKIVRGGSAIFTESRNQILLHSLRIFLIQNFEDIAMKIHAVVAKANPLCLYEIYEMFAIKNTVERNSKM